MCGNERGISSDIRIDLAAVSRCRRRPRHERGIHADKDYYNSQNDTNDFERGFLSTLLFL